MVCCARSSLNMDTVEYSDDEEEQHRQSRGVTSSSRLSSRFGKRRVKQTGSHQHLLLLMDCVGGSDNGEVSEETVPLPDYERLAQSARLPDDDTDDLKDPAPPSALVQQQTPAKSEASPPQPPPTQPQQQKPAAWRLIEYVRSRNRAGGAGAAGGCGVGSDGDSKSSDGEKEGEDGGDEGKDTKKKKKRSSWLPDPDRRWPVQGFY